MHLITFFSLWIVFVELELIEPSWLHLSWLALILKTLRKQFFRKSIHQMRLSWWTQVWTQVFSDRCFPKSFYIFMKSNYHGNIYSYKSSHLQAQKECILFGKLAFFSKCWHSMNEWFCCWISWTTVLFLNKEETPHAKWRL